MTEDERVLSASLMWTLAHRVCVLWQQWTNSQGLQKSCGEKGTAQPLSQAESTSTLALTGFYCFSGDITLRMVLIYYAQVSFRWLQKTKEKMLLITSKRKDICKC